MAKICQRQEEDHKQSQKLKKVTVPQQRSQFVFDEPSFHACVVKWHSGNPGHSQDIQW